MPPPTHRAAAPPSPRHHLHRCVPFTPRGCDPSHPPFLSVPASTASRNIPGGNSLLLHISPLKLGHQKCPPHPCSLEHSVHLCPEGTDAISHLCSLWLSLQNTTCRIGLPYMLDHGCTSWRLQGASWAIPGVTCFSDFLYLLPAFDFSVINSDGKTFEAYIRSFIERFF